MLWIKLIILFIMFMLLSPLIGFLLIKYEYQPKSKCFCESFVLGWVIMFALFECIAVPGTFLKLHLSTLVCIWTSIICILAIISFLKLKKISVLKISQIFSQSSLFSYKNLNAGQNKISILGITNCILIAFQCSIQLFFQHIDADDAWFVAASVAAVDTNSLNIISPYTGDILRWGQATDYLLAPFPLFWAMLSKISHIHPTIIMHNFAPFFLVCAAYMVYYLLSKQIFCNDHKKIELFLFFICLLNLFGFSFPRTTAAMLLLRIWQGKAMMGAFLLPLLMYYLFEHTYTASTKTVECKMAVVMVAMALGSSMGIFLGILLVGIYVFALYILKRNMWRAVKIIWSIIPSTLLGIIYVIIRHIQFN